MTLKKLLKEIEQKLDLRFRSPTNLALALGKELSTGATNRAAQIKLAFIGDALIEIVLRKFLLESGEIEASDIKISRDRFSSNRFFATILRSHNVIAEIEMFNDSRELNDQCLGTTFEAIIGAICQDRGERPARAWLAEYYCKAIDKELGTIWEENPQVKLQEIISGQYHASPTYKNKGKINGRFAVAIYIFGRQHIQGYGDTEKDARRDAAEKFLDRLEKNTITIGR